MALAMQTTHRVCGSAWQSMAGSPAARFFSNSRRQTKVSNQSGAVDPGRAIFL